MSDRNSRSAINRERNNQVSSSNKLKIIVSIIAIIVIIMLTIIVVINKVKNKKKNVIDNSNQFSNYEYFVLYSNEHAGVVDRTGKKIINISYVRIDIPNPQKDVFVCYSDDGKYDVFNKKGDRILDKFDEIDVVSVIEDDVLRIEKNILQYKKNGLYGLIDLDGNIIIDASYDEISSLSYKPGSILVKKDNKYGIIDISGNEIVEVKYSNISSDGYCSPTNSYDKTGYIVSEKSKNGVNYGYVDYKGNLVLDLKYESIDRALEYDEEDIFLIVMQKGKKGVFRNKKKIIDLNFQDINYSDISNVFVVNKNGKYGFFNNAGKVILKPQYTSYSIAGNYISVQKNDKNELFDINGNLVNINSYKKMIETNNPLYFIAENEDGYRSIISKDVTIDDKYTNVMYAFDDYFIFTDENGETGVINASTKNIEIQPEYDFIILIDNSNSFQAIDGERNLLEIYSRDLKKTVSMEDGILESLNDGFSVIYSETDIKYINSDGEIVPNTDVYPNKKLYSVNEDGKWGFKDKSGNIAIKCDYDIVTEFNEYGFAGIKKDNKWGVVSEEGKIIVEPSYELDTYYFPQFVGKYILRESEGLYCEEL